MKSKGRTSNFRKATFQLFMESINRKHWVTALRDKGDEHSWQTFKEAFHRSDLLAWLTQDLLVKLKDKKKPCRQLKQGQVS